MKNELDLTSLILQVYSVILLMKDCTNNTIMEELQKQDTQYFEKIIKQNDEILNLLKKEVKDE